MIHFLELLFTNMQIEACEMEDKMLDFFKGIFGIQITGEAKERPWNILLILFLDKKLN